MIQRWTNGSMVVGAWIEKWYGTKPDIVTYGGAECEAGKILDQTALRLDQNDKSLKCVFVGRVSEDTGARVYERVIGQMSNVTLDMYGEGSKLGTVADSCMVFLKYDVACVSSYLSIIEAMQSNTLVVAYASNELKLDYLSVHPRAKDIFIVQSEHELKKTILRLSGHTGDAQDDRIHEMTENAYEWARQQTWGRVYQKYLTLWKKL